LPTAWKLAAPLKKHGGEVMNIIDPKWTKAEHERQVAALVVMLQAFELISKGQGAAAAKARAKLGEMEAGERARTYGKGSRSVQ
jgi:hypothetical protein